MGITETAALIVAMLASPAAAQAPTAQIPTTQTRSAPERTYVALGDSFASGPLIPDQTGLPAGCLRSRRNYANLVAAGLGLELHDVSCFGARIKHLSERQLTVLSSNKPQLEALGEDTALVTVSIGANDADFTGISKACVLLSLTDAAGAPCKKEYGDALSRRISALGPKLAEALKAIRNRAPKARILFVTYLRILPEGPGCWPVVPVARGDVPYLAGLQREFNAMAAEQAAVHQVTYVDAYRDTDGRDVCAPPERKWVEGLLPTSPALSLHPNARGMREVAGRVLAAIKATGGLPNPSGPTNPFAELS